MKRIMLLGLLLISISMSAQIILLDENFNTVQSGIPAGWDNAEGSAVNPTERWKISSSGYDGQCLSFDSHDNAVGLTNVLKTPLLSLPANDEMVVRFMFKNDHGGSFRLYVLSDDGQPYTAHPLDTLLLSSIWVERSYSLSAFKGHNIRLVWHSTSNRATMDDPSHYLDDVLVDQISTCKSPIGIAAVGVSQTGATLVWNASSEAGDFPTFYQVYVYDAGGNLVFNNDSVSSSYNSVTITGLQPSSTYSVSIRGDCRATSNNYSRFKTFTFSTLCPPVAYPYINNFDSDNSIPQCMSHLNASINTDAIYAQGLTGRSLRLDPSASESSYVVFPLVGIRADSIEIDFSIRSYSYRYVTHYQVGVVSNPMNPMDDFYPLVIDSLTTPDWQTFRINSSAIDMTDNPSAICIYVNAGSDYPVFIDDVNIHRLPSCIRPERVTATNEGITTATIDWEMTNSSSYLIHAVSLTDSLSFTTTTHPYTLTGLAPSTEYYVYVTAVCGPNDISERSKPISIKTLCNVRTDIPFVESFENAQLTIPDCWNQGWLRNDKDNSATAPFNSTSFTHNTGLRAMQIVQQPAGVVSYLSTQAVAIPQANVYDVEIAVKRSDAFAQCSSEGITIWANTISGDTVGGTRLGSVARYYQGYPIESMPEWVTYSFPITCSGSLFFTLVSRSQDGEDIYFDDFSIKTSPSCRRVENVHVTNTSSSSITLSWDGKGNETLWAIKYIVKSSGVVVRTDSVTVSSPNYTIQNLSSSTAYTVEGTVYAVCSSTSLSEGKDFNIDCQTRCVPVSVPYFENFNSQAVDQLAVCWDNSLTTASNKYPHYFWGVANVGNRRLMRLQFDMNTTISDLACVTSPSIVLPAGGSYILSFNYYSTISTNYGQIGCYQPILKASIDNGATFFTIDSLDFNMTGWVEKEYTLDSLAGNTVILMFEAETSHFGYIYIDDIQLINAPSCRKIKSCEVDNILPNSARVSISDASATRWQYSVCTHGTSPENGTLVIVDGSMSAVMNNLLASTEYDVYVRRICNPGDTSAWFSNSVTFRTACSASNIPYVDEFENAPVGIISDGCYMYERKGTGYLKVLQGSYFNHTENGNRAVVSCVTDDATTEGYISGSHGAYSYVYLQADTNYEISMYVRKADETMFVTDNSNYNLRYFYGQNYGEDIMTMIGEHTISTSEWTRYASYFNVPADGYYFIGFNIFNNNTSLKYYFYGDDFLVRKVSCIPPVNSLVSMVTSNSATINFNSNSTRWVAAVSTSPIDPSRYVHGDVYHDTLTTTSVVIPNLLPNTTYYYSLRSVCSGSDLSEWMKPSSFITRCTPFTVPFTEEFESSTGTHSCWTSFGTGSATLSTAKHYEGYSSYLLSNVTIVSPEINVDSIEHYMVSGTAYATAANQSLQIGVMTDPDDVSSFVLTEEIPLSPNKWTEFTSFLTPVALEDPEYRGAKYITISSFSSAPLYLDNVIIDTINRCVRPKYVTVQNVQPFTADVSWTTVGDETSWIIKAVPLAAGATVIDTVTTNPYTITGLQSSTAYHLYVASLCSSSEISYWSDGGTFTTQCASLVPPTLEDFQTTDAGAVVNCWTPLYDDAHLWRVFDYKGERYMRLDVQQIPVGNASIESPVYSLPAGTVCELKFDYAHNASCGDFKVNIRRADESNYTTLTTLYKGTGASNSKPTDIRTLVLNLAAYAGSDVQFQLWASPSVSYGTGAIYVDNFIVREIKNCREVADIQVSNTTFCGADILITDTFANSQWEYMVVQRNGDTTAAPKVVVNTKMFTINNLAPTTAYDLYVRSYCSPTSQSNWEKVQFKTTAGGVTFPYYCDFADSAENLNWVIENGLTGSNTFLIGTDPLARISGSASLYVSTDGYSYGYDITSVSASCAARIVEFEAKKYDIEYTWSCSGGQGNPFGGAFDYARAYLVPAATGVNVPSTGMYYASFYPSNLIPLDDNTTMQVVEGWQTKSVTLDMSSRPGKYYLVFSWVNSNKNDCIQYPFAVDHLAISESNCDAVASVEKISDAGTTAKFRYLSGTSNAYTEWIVSESNTIFDTVSYGVATNDTTFTVTNLAPATKYYLFVRNDCGSSYSAWTSLAFVSGCAPLTTFPYYEDFESQNFPAPCWSITSVAQGYDNNRYKDGTWGRVNFTGHGFSGYYAEIGGAVGAEALLSLPMFHFEAGREYNLSFIMAKTTNSSSTDNVSIYLSENPSSVADAIYIGSEYVFDKNISVANGSYPISYDFPSNISGDYHIVFDGIYGTGALMIDDITVTQYPLCRNFTTIPTVEKKTSTTMLVSMPQGKKTAVQFAWAPYNSSGTTVHDTVGSVISTTGMALISGLTPNTSYNIYARGICADGDTTGWTPAARAITYLDDCFTPDNLHIVGDLGSNNAVIAYGSAPDALKYTYVLSSANDTLSGETTSDTLFFNALTPQTAYVLSVRAICDDTTDFVSLAFSTTQILASVPYVCGFEDNVENAQWVVNRSAQVTNFYVGGSQTTGVKSGVQAAYMSYNSNNYGQRLSSQASTPYGNLNNVNFLYRTFYLEPGTYDLSYDWRCDAYNQTSSDKYIAYGKAFFAPASVDLLVDNVAYVNNLPAQSTLVSPLRMEKQQDWTTEHHLVTITETGRYNLVFEWYSSTDASTANTSHLGSYPLAVDNVKLTTAQCAPFEGISIASLKCDTAVISLPFEASGQYFISTVDDENAAASAVAFTNETQLNVPVTAMTQYYFFARNICGEGDTSSWRRLSFLTPDSAAVLPYICGFETASENSHWHFTQVGQTNYFAINTYAKNGGTKGLYITKTGRQNEYNASRASVSYAWRDFYLEAGSYEYSFDWKCVGQSQSAYARAMILPQNVELTEGVLLKDVRYDMSPFSAVVLDNGVQMQGQTTWITESDICNIPETGSYRLVFVWTNRAESNDCSDCQTPLAIDNVMMKYATCLPLSLSSGSCDANSVTININNPNTGSLIEYTLSQSDSYTDVLLHDTVNDVASITLSDLVPSSTYIIYARALCDTTSDNNDMSLWRKIVVRTNCDVINRFPYFEGFEYLPAASHTKSISTICWNALNVDATQTQYNYTYPYYSVYDVSEKKNLIHSGERAMALISSSNDYLYLVLPEMDSINDLRMSLWYSGDGTGTENSALTVGYMTDAGNINSFVGLENLVKKTKYTRALVSYTSAPAHARMAIRYGGGSSDNKYGYLDDINVTRLVRGATYHDTICYNTPYNLHGFSVPVKDLVVGMNHLDYIKDAQNAGENDTLISAEVYVHSEIRTDIYDSICTGTPYSGFGFSIQSPETRCYTNTLVNSFGCDSLVNLYLTVAGLPTVTYDTICHGGSYQYGDTTITTSGKYFRSLTTPLGCLTSDTLYLVVLPDTVVEIAEICSGDYYNFHDQRYNQSGTYYVPFIGPRGCSQTAKLSLTVTSPTAERYDTMCAGGTYIYGSQSITQAGTYTRTYFDVKGCQITETLYLSVNPPIEAVEYDYACEGRPYFGHGFNGLNITKDTVIDYTSKTSALCDSITHLHITFVATQRTDTFVSVAEGESFTWHDVTYTQSGAFPVTLYSVVSGCDSIVTLHLKVGVGVDNVSTFDITLYPNPADNGQLVYVSIDSDYEVTSIDLLSATGALLVTQPDATSPISTASLSSGIYFIRVTTSDGTITTRKLVIR